MLKWTLDEKNYRIAVQTDSGFLQVKSVTNDVTEMETRYITYGYYKDRNGGDVFGKTEMPAPSWWTPRNAKKTTFTDFMTWYSSLPEGGTITITPFKYIPSVKRKTAKPLEGTDVEKMAALCSRFDISDPVYKYRQEALLVIGDTVKKIYLEKDYSNGGNSPAYYIRVHRDEKRYTTFAEIGDCLNAKGQPKITVNYRKRTLSVADLF